MLCIWCAPISKTASFQFLMFTSFHGNAAAFNFPTTSNNGINFHPTFINQLPYAEQMKCWTGDQSTCRPKHYNLSLYFCIHRERESNMSPLNFKLFTTLLNFSHGIDNFLRFLIWSAPFQITFGPSKTEFMFSHYPKLHKNTNSLAIEQRTLIWFGNFRHYNISQCYILYLDWQHENHPPDKPLSISLKLVSS